MRREFGVSILMASLLLFSAMSSSGANLEVSAEKKEITIRNLTKETIIYTIKPINSEEWEKRTIKPGALDRFPGAKAMDIDFIVQGRKNHTSRILNRDREK